MATRKDKKKAKGANPMGGTQPARQTARPVTTPKMPPAEPSGPPKR